MYQFFVKPNEVKHERICIIGSDVNHIKNVLRMSIGEQIRISDGAGREYLCEIEAFEPDEVWVRMVAAEEERTELPARLWLFQGLPKSDKMELIIQKAVELGVYKIVPVITRRTIVKLEGKKEALKVDRWNKIAESAAKQSQRSLIPAVSMPMTLKAACDFVKDFDLKIIPYELEQDMENAKRVVGQLAPGMDAAVFIGPEGGFETEEIELATAVGAQPISLGKRILRTETAGLAALSILMFQLECRQEENGK